MKSSRKLSRRSFLTRVAGGAVAAGGAMVTLAGKAEAQVSDNDSGPNGDSPGRGRGSNHIRGCTDNDRGPNADPASNGRGNGRSDSDSGPNSDPPNCGHHR